MYQSVIIKILGEPIGIEPGTADNATRFVYAFIGPFYGGFDFKVYFVDDQFRGMTIQHNQGDYAYRCSIIGKDNCPGIVDQDAFDKFLELSKKSSD